MNMVASGVKLNNMALLLKVCNLVQWLMENSWRYGFILRYPEDKSEITGIIYEPWHYRYVGKEYAKEIYESGLCLEEWLEAREAKWAIKASEE